MRWHGTQFEGARADIHVVERCREDVRDDRRHDVLIDESRSHSRVWVASRWGGFAPWTAPTAKFETGCGQRCDPQDPFRE